jgi:type II secretory pathway pseudopilin PulG
MVNDMDFWLRLLVFVITDIIVLSLFALFIWLNERRKERRDERERDQFNAILHRIEEREKEKKQQEPINPLPLHLPFRYNICLHFNSGSVNIVVNGSSQNEAMQFFYNLIHDEYERGEKYIYWNDVFISILDIEFATIDEGMVNPR